MLSENMASLGGEQIISTKDLSDSPIKKESRPSSVEKKTVARDRDEKLRLAKERQNEERQRKIEELRAQAEAAQKYREQKEEERRRRIEELRSKDNDRRLQVEERKKAIMEAEKERREYILRKNQVKERDARLDTRRKNEKGSIVFAFGSSTPRLLDPAELGSVSPSAYWGHRRSTSITNVAYTGAPLTRRSSERELTDGPKKRATSAGGIDRQNDDRRHMSTSMYEVFNWGHSNEERPQRYSLSIAAAEIDIDGPPTNENISKSTKEESTDSPPVSYRSVARRKTDLMPTIPSPRESSFGSRTSLYSHTPRTPGSRSGDVTPGGSINTSRPGSAMSTSTTASGLVQRRSAPPLRKPRPASIAVTGVSLNDELNKQKKEKPPLPKVQSTPKRAITTNNSNSATRTSSVDNSKQSERRSSFKKETITHKPKALFQSAIETTTTTTMVKNTTSVKSAPTDEIEQITEDKETVITEITQTKEEKEALNTEKCEVNNLSTNTSIVKEEKTINIDNIQTKSEGLVEEKTEEKVDIDTEKETKEVKEINKIKETKESVKVNANEIRETSAERQDNDMTASMMARKITTEEQAKAALAERRRLARDEAERQAELERQRIEAERQAELKRQAEEEEKQRKFEEETLRMAEEQRKAEEERLLQAIEEAKKREEAERLKREDEEKLKVEREEAERKAKEEAEKQRLEVAERLKREEKEREERRKRVEAIMSRTRAKGGGNSTPNSTPTKDNENNKTVEKDEKPEEKTTTDEQQIIVNSTEINQNNDKTENVVPIEKVESITMVQQTTEQNSYEKSVTDKENALMKSFSNMIVDEQQQNTKVYPNFPNPFGQVTNGKIEEQKNENNDLVIHTIANGNGHTENLNKNATNDLVDLSSATITDQLIDFSNESQQITDAVNFNNNNSLLTSSTPLVTSDSHENKEISLL